MAVLGKPKKREPACHLSVVPCPFWVVPCFVCMGPCALYLV